MMHFKTPNKVLSFFIVTFTLAFATPALAQKDALRLKIITFAAACKGDVGVSILGLEDRDTLSYHGNKHYAMQSVYKLHLAMAVLAQVDKGKLSLSQKVNVTKKDLRPDTWSPLRDEYPEGNASITLYDILKYTVSQSDNNGCDILFRLLGGTEKVNAYIHNLGITQTAIVATEEDMHKKWDTQFTNWSETNAIAQLLDIIFQRKLLSTTSNILLWKCPNCYRRGSYTRYVARRNNCSPQNRKFRNR